MPRLGDLLEFMAKPGHEHVWVLLDIKQRDNDLDDVMRLIAETIAAVPPSPSRPWTQRIVLGVWAAKYLPFISQYLPHFPLTYISFSLPCAYHFLRTVPKMSFNMYAPILAGPLGAAFRKKAHRLHRPVFVWTVNKERAMRWSIEKGLDGVVTDDPAKFLDACDRWEGGGGGGAAVADGAEGSGERGGAVKGLREEERWRLRKERLP
ncbi:putative glycerophosphoryl diester phosphodiesterase family protein [Neofusicoccum parvum UCRNP2]|uniref:Putative glycerophosphoryl diester phosphodiesterase family protein n=1 Tax=Botryosphaeria parva (strain UCR-NP2) TaxID=1287680 RepID=R1GAU8_BOTPV|nr:putative glycerophosphoryl diester phosphodiesterase family protein [Neofusicoccum parvum UCRNP2]